MKKGALWMLPILALVSCQELEPLTENELQEEPVVKGVHMTVPEIPFDSGEAQTKSAMTVNEATGLSFVWSEGDATGVYSTTDGFARYGLATGDGMADATFTGGGFDLTDGSTYYAFYPYAMSAEDKTAIPLVYSGQNITADNDMISPMTKDYLWASAVSDAGNATFSFAHIGSFLRMKIGLPEGTAIDKVELVPMYEEVPQTLTFDITSQTPTVSTSLPVMTVSATGVTVPASGQATVWAAMPPQDFSADSFAVQVTSGTDVFSARAAGKAFTPGKAYRWEIAPVDVTSDPGYGFGTVEETGLSNVTTAVGAGQYSGITWLGGTQYAVVDDKLNGGGIVFYYFTIKDDGTVGDVSKSIPTGTSGSGVTGRDNEGIAFVPGSPGTLFVSAEADQSIREYDRDGVPTGRTLTIPADMAVGKISANKGFEALTYDAATEQFWTITESELTKDAATPGLLRLQSFGTDLKPSGRYLYQMDSPKKTSVEAAAARSYVFGAPALAALNDGRIIVLEREVYVPNDYMVMYSDSFTRINLYVVNPSNDGSGILRKTLLKSFDTSATNLANYEGMCVGPTLSDGSKTLVLIPDSQGGYTVYGIALLKEYVKVITFK